MELNYFKTKRGLQAQAACAMARIECSINIYEGGFIDEETCIISQNTKLLIGRSEGCESVEAAKANQARALSRWFGQEWVSN